MSDSSPAELVSACGIYCGACRRYRSQVCPGCAKNERASWCRTRECVRNKGYRDCAECSDFSDVNRCEKFNTRVSRLFSLVFRWDRPASLRLIGAVGRERYAERMEARGEPVLKRGREVADGDE